MSQNPPLKGSFRKGERACMQVVTITENVKGFNTNDGYRYRHDIVFVNEDKQLLLGEYLSPQPTQDIFSVAKKACFEARDHSVIVPIGEPDEWERLGDNILLPKTSGGEAFIVALQEANKIHVAKIAMGMALEPKDLFQEADLMYDWLLSKQKRSLNITK